MTILITGATGLIGRVLTQTLLDNGARVRILTRRPHRALELFDDRVNAYEWHPRSEPLPAGALDGVERIVHLLGEPLLGRPTPAKRERIVASRRIATGRLLEALDRRRVHLILASSVAVYGFGAGPPIGEQSAVEPPRAGLPLELRGCEEAAEAARGNGSLVTLVRLGLVMAPGAFPAMLVRLMESGIAWRDQHADAVVPAIDLTDAAALFAWLAFDKPIDGAVNAVAPQPLRSADLEALVLHVVRRKPVIRLPRWILRRHIGALADLLHSRRQIVPQRAIDARFAFARPDPMESAKHVLIPQQPPPKGAPPRKSLLRTVLQRG
jgi:uncharacterized protein